MPLSGLPSEIPTRISRLHLPICSLYRTVGISQECHQISVSSSSLYCDEFEIKLVLIESMTVLKRYVLRLFMSSKYITANLVDRNNGRVVTTTSTVEHAIKNSVECGRTCNAKASVIVGEVLAMRLKMEGLHDGQGRGIHADVKKEIEKKGFKSRTKVWTVINSLRNNGVPLILDDYDADDDKDYRDRSCESHR